MSTELITQLIILATAVVGLYKAATYKPADPEHIGSNEPGPVSAAFAGLISFLGIFAFMLAMPAFIWAFTWITGNIGSSHSSEPTVQYEIAYKPSENPSNIELMLIAASQIPYESSRGQALEIVSDRALSEGNFRIATVAASAIPYESSRGSQLREIVDKLSEIPNKLMQTTADASAE
ncbi:hypothetical protein BCU92_02570 [Vibrio cyclitrophicus]|uniref:hypothetical protein n=1 Tax=Vibrio cyclitrophicus TaxID=47951 RepID=UPI000C820926|nr:MULTISPECIES: hypothetical protein [Vibrio]PMG39246.1 hypothetical protein BCU92_18455 [Vibrio cyclitrophicus]PMH60263.1 hypothetical protein BCU64_19340 [Vibrio lentus]